MCPPLARVDPGSGLPRSSVLESQLYHEQLGGKAGAHKLDGVALLSSSLSMVSLVLSVDKQQASSSLSWDPRSSRWRGRSPPSGYRSLSPWVCSGLGSKRMEGTNLEFPPPVPEGQKTPCLLQNQNRRASGAHSVHPSSHFGSRAVLGPSPEPLRQGQWEDGGSHCCFGVL